jgi:uncharacterized membrane protein YgcG
MAGLFLLIGFSSAMTLFGSVVAESIGHGVSVYYLSYSVCGAILVVLWKRGIVPVKSASVLLAVGALGFVAAIASLYFPAFSLAACTLLGTGLAVCTLSGYFGLVMLKRYPSRFIMPLVIAIALIAVIIHAGVLEAFRDNPHILYVIYLGVSVAMVILYQLLEPVLFFSFRSRTVQGFSGGGGGDSPSGGDGAPGGGKAAGPEASKRPPLLGSGLPRTQAETLLQREESIHVQRMNNLGCNFFFGAFRQP